MNHRITVRLHLSAAALLVVALFGSRALGQDAPTTQPAAAPLFTEDFESGALNPDIWSARIFPPATQPSTPGPTITVESDVVAHGKYALLVHYPAVPRSYAFIVANHLPDSLKDHFFGRAYVQFPKAPPNAHDVFITAGSAGWPISNFLEIGLRQNKAQLSYQQNAKDIPRGEQMYAGPAYPVGKWFCLEWEFNDNPDSITIWIDGDKVTDTKVVYKGTADHLVKDFVDFGFGFRSWGRVPNGFDVYYDDIAIGSERIGPIK
ncbi:MAG: hypothetical protein ABSH22_18275 [Tepidisphaeraceae bacterium]